MDLKLLAILISDFRGNYVKKGVYNVDNKLWKTLKQGSVWEKTGNAWRTKNYDFFF